MGVLGYWRERPEATVDAGGLTWNAPGRLGLRVWTGTIQGKCVARISRQPGHGSGCSAWIDGWVWTEQAEGGTAERLGIKETPTRVFQSVPDDKRAIKAAFKLSK